MDCFQTYKNMLACNFCVDMVGNNPYLKGLVQCWRFSNSDPVVNLVLRLILTVRTGWHGWLWKSVGEPIFGFHMNENWLWESVLFIYLYFGEPKHVLSKYLHLVLNSFEFKVPKQSLSHREVEVLFRVRDKKKCIKMKFGLHFWS
jgi:hypothetical protein